MGRSFCRHVARLGFLQSAAARGPGDNSHMESFFHSLKGELTRGVVYHTERELRTALQCYIRYYNAKRMHSGLNYLTPNAFECQCA